MTTKIEILIERLGKTKDAEEFMLTTEHNKNRYVGFIEITGPRIASEKGDLKHYINKAKNKFENMIITGEIKPKDKPKFCFWVKGDFIKFQERSKDVNIKGNITKYSNDRLHIEIPKAYKHLFEEGEEVRIIKE